MSAAEPPRCLGGGSAAWLALAMLVNLALVSHFWNRFWYAPDEGNYAHVAERLLDGEVLNRDVQDVHLGTINLLHAGTMAVFGRSMSSLRIPLMAATLLQALLVFLLFRPKGGALAALASVAVTVLGVLQFLNPTAHWYSQVLCFALVLALERLSRGWRFRYETLGLLVGVLTTFRQLTGVLVAMGLLAWLLVEREPEDAPENEGRPWLAWLVVVVMGLGLAGYLKARSDLSGAVLLGLWPLLALGWTLLRTASSNRATAGLLLRLGGGALLALLPLALYHLAHGTLGSWYHDVVTSATALSALPFIHQQNLASLLFAGGIEGAARAESFAAVVNGLFWAVVTLCPALTGAALALSLRRRQTPPAPLPFIAVFYGVVPLHFQNATYLFFALGVSLTGLLWLAGESSPRRTKWACGLVAVLAAVALCYHAAQPVNRGASGLFKGERWPLVEAQGIPRCGLRIDKYDLAAYTLALQVIEREVPAGETILALPSNAELYFLSRRKNPFRFFNFSIGVLDMDEVEKVDRKLRSEPPKLVFWSPDDKYNTELSRELMKRLAARYQPLARVGYWEVYRRPDPVPAP